MTVSRPDISLGNYKLYPMEIGSIGSEPAQKPLLDIRKRYRLEVLDERAWSSLSHYSEFWLNSFIDLHAYKNVF